MKPQHLGIAAVIAIVALLIATTVQFMRSEEDASLGFKTVTVRDTTFVHETITIYDTVTVTNRNYPKPSTTVDPKFPHEYTFWYVDGTKDIIYVNSTIDNLRGIDVLEIGSHSSSSATYYVIKNMLKIEYKKR